MRIYTQQQFIEKCTSIHGNKYNYTKFQYINYHQPGIIICSIHGTFVQSPHAHCRGQGCPKCGEKCRRRLLTSNTSKFVKKAQQVHNKKFSYNKTHYRRATEKVIITCPLHTDFEQTPTAHLSGQGCPKCKASIGELQIEHWLKKSNLSYKTQYRISGCKRKRTLPFDFAVFNETEQLVSLIEYQGEQHYTPKTFFGGLLKLEYQKENDSIKKSFCIKHRIPLLEIRYDQKDIKGVLSNFLIKRP